MKDREAKYKLTKSNDSKFGAFIDVFRLRGACWVFKYSLLTLASNILGPLWSNYYKGKYKVDKLPKDTFKFNKKNYKYFSHPYNQTWKHERAIEIPLAESFLKKFKPQDTLEIGNVLSNYFSVSHTIVDNYEIAKGVINEDVMDYSPKKRFKLIVSISTLEHVGVDGVKEEGKAVGAIAHLSDLLAPKGMLLFTIPIGYNKALDKAVKNRKIKLDEAIYFKKVSVDNKWVETREKDVKNVMYGFPFHWGNAVLLGIIKK